MKPNICWPQHCSVHSLIRAAWELFWSLDWHFRCEDTVQKSHAAVSYCAGNITWCDLCWSKFDVCLFFYIFNFIQVPYALWNRRRWHICDRILFFFLNNKWELAGRLPKGIGWTFSHWVIKTSHLHIFHLHSPVKYAVQNVHGSKQAMQ